MAYTKFNPRGEGKVEEGFVRRQRENPYVVAIQLFGIFLLLRVVMLVMGMPFFSVPIVDPLLAKIVRMVK